MESNNTPSAAVAEQHADPFVSETEQRPESLIGEAEQHLDPFADQTEDVPYALADEAQQTPVRKRERQHQHNASLPLKFRIAKQRQDMERRKRLNEAAKIEVAKIEAEWKTHQRVIEEMQKFQQPQASIASRDPRQLMRKKELTLQDLKDREDAALARVDYSLRLRRGELDRLEALGASDADKESSIAGLIAGIAEIEAHRERVRQGFADEAAEISAAAEKACADTIAAQLRLQQSALQNLNWRSRLVGKLHLK